MQKGFAPIILVVIVLIAVLAAGGGYYFGVQKNQTSQPVFVIPTLTPVSPVSTNDSTVDWKTYIDEKSKFQFSYPQTWNLEVKYDDSSQINRVSIQPSDYKNTTAGNILILPEKTNLKSIDSKSIDERFSTESNSSGLRDFKTDIINGQTVITAYGGCCMDIGKKTFLLRDGVLYIISLYSADLNNFPLKNEGIYDQILSTFKFTDQTPTPTCMPRPKCLDSTPRCLIPEPINGWCKN